jgi:hypothetical protein
MEADLTPMRIKQRDAADMIQYCWLAITGTQQSIGSPHCRLTRGFERFEAPLEEFRIRFDDHLLRRQWWTKSFEAAKSFVGGRRRDSTMGKTFLQSELEAIVTLPSHAQAMYLTIY